MTKFTEEQKAEIRKLAEAYQNYSHVQHMRTSAPPDRLKALRHYGFKLACAQIATGVELVSQEEREAVLAVAEAAFEYRP